ncbi:MAG: hypothetical protein JW892_08080 [Anaerolineae bacterium]|nr:hypothetical protein [Anaerolineae bacterium]
MRKAPLLVLLALLLGACQIFAATTPTVLPPTQPPETETATPPSQVTPTATPIPTPEQPHPSLEEILATLPFTAGTQPNGSFVVQEIQQADLTGDGQEDVIITSGWKQNEAEEFPIQLQVDIISAQGIALYSQNTWEELGESPSTMLLDEYSFLMFNQIEAVDIVSLTGEVLPQVVVRIRYSGTGSILEAHILSFRDGAMQSLADITAYKGWMEYQREGYVLSYPLYLYNEPNCCPCRRETVTYTWDGAAFVTTQTLREEIEGMEGCPPFPTPTEWRALNAVGASPPARRDAALVYDSRREQIILFGGRDGIDNLNDTWVFDLATSTWSELVPADGRSPSPRHSMVAGLDAMHDQVVIATGTGEVGTALNEVWTLNLSTRVWRQQITLGAAPSERFGAAGGIPNYGQTLILSHGFNFDRSLDDTWALDLETFTWSNITPAGVRPVARGWHSAVPLSWTQIVLFGGYTDLLTYTPPQGDTWVLNLLNSNWNEVIGSGPSPREFSSMVTLGDRGTALLFGGRDAANVELNDVWRFDPGQGSWREITPENAGPSARQGHSMTLVGYSSLTPGSAVAIFGGLSDNVMRNDLWLFIPWDE